MFGSAFTSSTTRKLPSTVDCIVKKIGYKYFSTSKFDQIDKESCKPLKASITYNFQIEIAKVTFYADCEFAIKSVDVVYDFGNYKLPEIFNFSKSNVYTFFTTNIPRHVFYPQFTCKVVYSLKQYPGNFQICFQFDIPYFASITTIELVKLDGYGIPEKIKSVFKKEGEAELLRVIKPKSLSREEKFRHALYIEDLTSQHELSHSNLKNVTIEQVHHDSITRRTLYHFEVKSKNVLPASVLETSLEFIPMSKNSKERKETGNVTHYFVERLYEDDSGVTWIEFLKMERIFNAELLDLDLLYEVHFIPNNITFKACHKALNSLQTKSLDTFFTNFDKSVLNDTTQNVKIFGGDEFVWYNKNIMTNKEQKLAIMNIVNCSAFPLPYCIFGPPGTGKTSCIVECVLQILKLKPASKILITAQSNSACNEIGGRLLQFMGIHNIFRLYSSRLLHSNPASISKKLLPSSNLRQNKGILPTMEELKHFPVIISSISSCSQFDRALLHNHFDYIFIDESAATTEPEAYIPIVELGCGTSKVYANIVLVGDPKQLPPVVSSKVANELGLNVSLMERIMTTPRYQAKPDYDPDYITQLLDNYRSHPSILHFSNVSFYESKLKSKGTGQIISLGMKWRQLPNKKFPILFHCTKTPSKKVGTSSYNEGEIKTVKSFVSRLLNEGIGKKKKNQKIVPEDIGVVTPYKAQAEKLKEILPKNVEVGTSEYYQGREKLIMIFSTVKSQTGIGFLGDERRLNVCLTRAKALMIVVGNANTLQQNKVWRRFINFCKENNSCVGEKFVFKKVDDPIPPCAASQMLMLTLGEFKEKVKTNEEHLLEENGETFDEGHDKEDQEAHEEENLEDEYQRLVNEITKKFSNITFDEFSR